MKRPLPAPGAPMDAPARLVALAGLLAAPLLGLLVVRFGPWPLAAALGLVAAVVLARRPTLGVYALVGGTFFDELHIPAGFALLGAADLAAFGLIPAWLARRLLAPRDLRLPGGHPLLWIYLALAFASLMLGVAPHTARGNYARLLTYAAALLAVVDLVRTEDVLDGLIRLMALCGLAHAVVALVDPGDARRLMGLADQPNILGVRIALGALPAAALWQRSRGAARALWGLALGLMLVAVALTISRGTYLALTAAFVWWMRRSPKLALVVALAGLSTWVGIERFAEERAARIQQRLDFDDSSVTNRGVVARNAGRVVIERPLLGVGFGQFRDLDRVVGVTDQAGRGSHNFYLGVAASTGLPALACLLGFVGWQLRRLRAPPDAGPRLVWLVAVVQALAVYHMTSLLVRGGLRLTDWTLFALYASLAAVIAHRDDRETPTA